MQITPLNGDIGAEVQGIDVAAGLTDDEIVELRSAWLEHLVLFIREQRITPPQQLTFARQLGEPASYPFLKGLAGHEPITEVLKREDESVNFGGVWHTDTVYQPCPPMATILYALELPASGGDTLFASQYAALQSLSPALRQTLGGLRAIHSAANKTVAATRMPRTAEHGTGTRPDRLSAIHPVIRRHPETGRRSLFLSPAHTVAFEHWTTDESRPLLDYLFWQQTRAEWTCRHRWQTGDLALWDNRCCLHYPLNDYHGQRRLLHRVTLAGDTPAGFTSP